MNIHNTVRDAAGPMSIALGRIDSQIVGFNVYADLTVKFRTSGVEITLRPAVDVSAAARTEKAWAILIAEFEWAGWGFRSLFENGLDNPRTSIVFDHPLTLTRIVKAEQRS